MHVTIHTAAVPSATVAISNEAAQHVRMGFNPSALANVDELKALAAAFISKCDQVAAQFRASSATVEADEARAEAGRALSVAKTHMQTASMWAVLGATTNAPAKPSLYPPPPPAMPSDVAGNAAKMPGAGDIA